MGRQLLRGPQLFFRASYYGLHSLAGCRRRLTSARSEQITRTQKTLSPTVDAVSMLHHYSFDESNNVTESNRRFRLVKRSKNFVWLGVVHEDLVTEDKRYTYFDSDIVVTHRKPADGPSSSQRNLRIFEKHLN